jgi:hypothetical protein
MTSRHEVVSALDLNPLKNMKRDNAKSQDGKISQIAMEDAATGTVTALVDNTIIEKKEEPTSCNEIMAKAVVIASEEKEAAISARDAALVEVASAKAKADELSSKIEVAVAEARNATIEFEAMKLLADRLVQEARHEAALNIERMQNKTSEQLESHRRQAQNELSELQKQCEDALEKSQADAKDQKEKDQVEKIALKEQWDQQVTQLKDEMQALENDWQGKMLRVVQDSEQKVNGIQKESKEAVQAAYKDAQLTVNEALERASNIEKEAKLYVDETEKRTTALLQDMETNTNERLDKMRMECSSELEEKDHIYEKILHENEKKHSDMALLASKKEQELQSVIESQQVFIQSLEKMQETLEENVSKLHNDVKYWKDLHDNQGFVNTTLVMIESQRVLDQSVIVAQDWLFDLNTFMVGEIKVVSRKCCHFLRPYSNEIQRYYHLHLESKINELVLPFYQTRMVPVYIKAEHSIFIPLRSKSQAIMAEILKDIARIKVTEFQRICSVTQRCASSFKRFILSDDVRKRFAAPQSIIMALSHIENDASGFVQAAIKVISLFALYYFRKAIVSLVLRICFLPLNIVWYFCPLRLIWRRRKYNKRPNDAAERRTIVMKKESEE